MQTITEVTARYKDGMTDNRFLTYQASETNVSTTPLRRAKRPDPGVSFPAGASSHLQPASHLSQK